MRSVHSPDLKHHAFVDGFGLTRLSLPNRVKTARKVLAGLEATLSRNAAGTEILACHEGAGEMHHLAFPALTPFTSLDRHRLLGASLAPEEGYVDVISDGRRDPRATLRRWRDPYLPPSMLPLDLQAAPKHAGVTVEGADAAERPLRLVASPAGVWAALVGPTPMLLVGDFAVPSGRLRWSAPLGVPREAWVTLHPFDDGQVVVVAHCPSRRDCTVLGFDAAGGEVAVTLVDARGPAVPLSPEVMLHQRDDETVVRTTLRGRAEAVTPLGGDAQGPGRVFGRGAAAFFVPWHAETVIDLRTGAEHARKLGDADAAVRRELRAQIRRANALGNPAGILFELSRAELVPRKRQIVVAAQSTPGGGALQGVLAAGWLSRALGHGATDLAQPWSRASLGGLNPHLPHDRWDVAEVDHSLAALASADLPLLACLGHLASSYTFDPDSSAPVRRGFTDEGARRFLAALVHALHAVGGEVSGVPSRDRDSGLRADDVVRAVEAAGAGGTLEEPEALLDLVAMLSVQVLGRDASAVVAALCRAPWAGRISYNAQLPAAVRWLRGGFSDAGNLCDALLAACEGRAVARFLVVRGLG